MIISHIDSALLAQLLDDRSLVKAYVMAGDGMQAPGAIVLRRQASTPGLFACHFANLQVGGFSSGWYDMARTEAERAYAERCTRYDRTGMLHQEHESYAKRQASAWVIRSMSTNDAHDPYGRPQEIVPYHIFLQPAEKRAGAWWTSSFHGAQRFTSEAEALAERDRLFAKDRYSMPEVAPIDADKRGLSPYWENQRLTTARAA